jgi:pyruvate kinase
VDLEELPVIQRMIVRKCAIAGKPSIVATHLLESMIENPMPTRAEVTDVANAITEQADAIMLSGETATGAYPDRCVSILDRIARRIEREPSLGFYTLRPATTTQREHIAQSACRLADAMNAAGIIVVTRRGLFGQLVSSYRPARTPIYAFTNMSTSRRKLALLRGVVPFRMRLSNDPQKTIDAALARIREQVPVAEGAKFVVVSDVRASSGELVTSIQVRDA